VLDTQSNVFV